jgi:hypothetical protein
MDIVFQRKKTELKYSKGCGSSERSRKGEKCKKRVIFYPNCINGFNTLDEFIVLFKKKTIPCLARAA